MKENVTHPHSETPLHLEEPGDHFAQLQDEGGPRAKPSLLQTSSPWFQTKAHGLGGCANRWERALRRPEHMSRVVKNEEVHQIYSRTLQEVK